MKEPKFPLEVKCGAITIKIYRTKCRGYVAYALGDYATGKRVLRSFADLDQAKAEAERIALQMLRGEAGVASLTAAQKLSYVRAAQALETAAVPVDLAAIQFAEAQKVLKGTSLIRAAEFYATRNGTNLTPSRSPPRNCSASWRLSPAPWTTTG